jgi:predicted ATPase
LDRIVFRDNTERTKPIHAPLSFEEVLTKIKVNKLAELKEYTLPNIIKFLLAIRNEIPVFETIIHSFIEVFPEVKKVGAATDIYGTSATYTVEMILNEDDTGVPQVKMSSGMLRFLMLLIDLHLSPDGSIFLIDEIENSLGINCLDEYVHQLQHANPNIQIIATSHHPYIINNIPYQQWKVVKRKGAVISVMDAEDLGIGQSRQEAFIQLNKVLKK